MSSYSPIPDAHRPAGHVARWATWEGDGEETTSIVWENEGFIVSGHVSKEKVQYVLRLSATWQVRQFLLFRDMDEPDLWLATDGAGRWGEMNGAHRSELDGCYDIDLACTPFTSTPPIRRLALSTGHSADLPVVCVDPETLDVHAAVQRYTRVASHRWRREQAMTGLGAEFEVDEFGLVSDYPLRFRRLA